MRSALKRLRSDERGESSWVTYLVLIGILVGGYLLVVYTPLFLDHYAAKSKCNKVLNETWRYKDENKTAARMRKELKKIAQEEVVENGETKKVPAIDPEPHELQVEIDRSVQPPMMRIHLDYERIAHFPFLKKTRPQRFDLECEISLGFVDY